MRVTDIKSGNDAFRVNHGNVPMFMDPSKLLLFRVRSVSREAL